MGNRLWLAPHFFVVCLNILYSGVFMARGSILFFCSMCRHTYCGEI